MIHNVRDHCKQVMDTNHENESVDGCQGKRASGNHSANTQVAAIPKQSIVYKTIFVKILKRQTNIYYWSQQANDQNPDYEPSSIYDGMYEDNHDNTYDHMYEHD